MLRRGRITLNDYDDDDGDDEIRMSMSSTSSPAPRHISDFSAISIPMVINQSPHVAIFGLAAAMLNF